MAPYGFDMVTLGGYNVDKPTIEAGCSIIQRGRQEFNINEENLLSTIKKEADTV